MNGLRITSEATKAGSYIIDVGTFSPAKRFLVKVSDDRITWSWSVEKGIRDPRGPLVPS